MIQDIVSIGVFMKKIVVFMVGLAGLFTAVSAAPEPIDSNLDFFNKMSNASASIAERTLPSVVSITAEIEETAQPFDPFGPMGGNDMFRHFFDSPFFKFRRSPGSSSNQSFNSVKGGSGFIVSSDGYIVTNQHVVKDASRINVKLSDKREYKAKVIGLDADTDVAVLKIEAENLIPLPFVDSDNIKTGQFVLAIGSPFNLDSSVSNGVISGKYRKNRNMSQEVLYLQTSAPINSGNSGGPLVMGNGGSGVGCAGVCNWRIITDRNGAVDGIGFAIPSNLVKRIMGQLIEKGYVERPKLGVVLQDIHAELAKALNIKGDFSSGKNRDNVGVLITNVNSGSAASEAGIEKGDIIVEADDKRAENSFNLRSIIASKSPGDFVKLKILRNGKAKCLKAKLSKSVDEEAAAAFLRRIGISVSDVYNTALKEAEVVVSQVNPCSIAFSKGLRPNSVISGLMINGKKRKVSSVGDLMNFISEAASEKDGNTIAFVLSDGSMVAIVM